MADVAARRRYASRTRPLTVKQRVQETSVAHLEHVEGTSETEEAIVTRFDGGSDHGRADFVNDGVPVTAVGKMTKQEQIKHHRI